MSRIDETEKKTPDYELDLDGTPVIVEVKEMQPNPSEKASMEKLKREGIGLVTGGVPGERVRSKIESASAQIKARTMGQYPSLLVVCDIRHGCGQITGHVDRYNLRVAMEGLDQVVLSVPNDLRKSPQAIGMKSGPRKKMTESANTSISAIAVISTPPGEPIALHVYHNNHAAIPLPVEKIRKCGIPQFKLSGNTGEPSDWIEL